MAVRYCKVCGDFHSLDDEWPEECFGHWRQVAAGPQIIRDIEPYRAVAGDVASGGKAPVITSRSDHRQFLKRNGYIEVGNEKPVQRQVSYSNDVTPREVKQVIDRLRSERR